MCYQLLVVCSVFGVYHLQCGTATELATFIYMKFYRAAPSCVVSLFILVGIKRKCKQ